MDFCTEEVDPVGQRGGLREEVVKDIMCQERG